MSGIHLNGPLYVLAFHRLHRPEPVQEWSSLHTSPQLKKHTPTTANLGAEARQAIAGGFGHRCLPPFLPGAVFVVRRVPRPGPSGHRGASGYVGGQRPDLPARLIGE